MSVVQYHNIFDVGVCLKEVGFHVRNMITWQKNNRASFRNSVAFLNLMVLPPNLGCRCFKHSTEFIIWAVKDTSKHYFNYELMKELNGGKQMADVWTGPRTPMREKRFGKHPTQKPLYLLERIIRATSQPGDWILDPFCGSGTTGVAAVINERNFVGIDNSEEYIKLSQIRIDHELQFIRKENTK